jgi:hypothetical protein
MINEGVEEVWEMNNLKEDELTYSRWRNRYAARWRKRNTVRWSKTNIVRWRKQTAFRRRKKITIQ